jgi:hypothetical protein
VKQLLGFFKSRIVWIGPPRLTGRLVPGANHFRATIKRTNKPFLDSSKCSFPMWSDKIHPSIPGRKIWAKWIWTNLTRTKEE